MIAAKICLSLFKNAILKANVGFLIELRIVMVIRSAIVSAALDLRATILIAGDCWLTIDSAYGIYCLLRIRAEASSFSFNLPSLTLG